MFSKYKVCTQNTIRFNDRDDDFAYSGIENTFEFKSNYTKNDSLTYSFTDGKIGFKHEKYTYKTKPCDSTTFFVHKGIRGQIVHIQTIKIRKIPEPSIAINGIELKMEIDKLILINSNKIEGYLDADNWLKDKLKVISFNLKFVTNKGDISLESKNDFFTKDMIEKIQLLNSGDKIVFEKILLSRPEGYVRYLNHDIPLLIK
ncbi:MAG: hypothetical protein A2046_07425 [Bacteroidetes bacterium GWA2_30_7]|nr:MAG: hypothetical protein A2046_07425 [Bacteroidetes bacterium GWA2_30_7]